MPLPSTGLKISPTSFILAMALWMVKSFIFNTFFTSSHYSGIDTVAPGFGRSEYGAASVVFGRFFKKSR